MRSTPGCGTLVGPSLELEGFQSQIQKGSAEIPGLKHASALGRPGGPVRGRMNVLLQRYDMYIPGIYLLYDKDMTLFGKHIPGI